jgi:hypothetical protein
MKTTYKIISCNPNGGRDQSFDLGKEAALNTCEVREALGHTEITLWKQVPIPAPAKPAAPKRKKPKIHRPLYRAAYR